MSKRDIAKNLNIKSKFVKKLANNTYHAVVHKSKCRYIIYHDTAIITYHFNGYMRLSSGGWHTRSTKQRINRYIRPTWHLFQKDYEWYLSHERSDKWYRFQDGFLIDPDDDVAPEYRFLEVPNPFLTRKSKREKEDEFRKIDLCSIDDLELG